MMFLGRLVGFLASTSSVGDVRPVFFRLMRVRGRMEPCNRILMRHVRNGAQVVIATALVGLSHAAEFTETNSTPWECQNADGSLISAHPNDANGGPENAKTACGAAADGNLGTVYQVVYVGAIMAFTEPPPPPPPLGCTSGPVAAPVNLSLVDNVLSWDQVENACSYRVRSKKDQNSPINPEGETVELSMDLSHLAPGTVWRFGVSAINADGVQSPETWLRDAEIVAGGPTPLPSGQEELSWQNPTEYADNRPLPPSNLRGTSVHQTQPTPLFVRRVDQPSNATVIDGLSSGVHCWQVFSHALDPDDPTQEVTSVGGSNEACSVIE